MSESAITGDQAVSIPADTAPPTSAPAQDTNSPKSQWSRWSCNEQNNFDDRCNSTNNWKFFYERTAQEMYAQNGGEKKGEKKVRKRRSNAISKAMQTASNKGDKPQGTTCLEALRPFMEELMKKRMTEDSKLISDFVTKQRLSFRQTDDISCLTKQTKLEPILDSVYDSLITHTLSGRVHHEVRNNNYEYYPGHYKAERESFLVGMLQGLYTGKAKMTAEDDTLRFELMALSERYPNDQDSFANYAGFTWNNGAVEPLEPTHEVAFRNQDSSA